MSYNQQETQNEPKELPEAELIGLAIEGAAHRGKSHKSAVKRVIEISEQLGIVKCSDSLKKDFDDACKMPLSVGYTPVPGHPAESCISDCTPGPWKIGAIESGRVAVDGPKGEEVTGWIDPNDGVLISAAHELYNELAHAQAQLELTAEAIEAGRIKEALMHCRSMAEPRQAALAKARGEAT